MRGGAVLVRLNAAPVDGAANKELIAVLADALGIAKRNLTIISGEHSRTKKVRIEGTDASRLETLARREG